MATEVARLTAKLDADTRAFDRAMGKSDSRFQKVGRAIKVGALAAGAGVAYGLGKVAKIGWDEFNEGQRVAAQTNAVLKSTGGVANVTGGHVDKLSERLMNLSGIDDEVIKSGENMLLTFTNIRNEAGKGNKIFDRATKAALDLSVATGKDLVGANVMVGKALQDPVRGLTALRRVGVNFTEQQEKQIKRLVESGDTMKAQKVILRELTKEFGGSAKAAGDTLGGQINILRERFNNWAGDIVAKAIPAIKNFAEDALPVVERAIGFIREKGQQFIDWIRGTLVPVIQEIISTARSLWDRFGDDIKRNFQAAFKIIRAWVQVVIGIIRFFAAILRGDWSAAWQALKSIVRNALTAVVTLIKTMFTNVFNAAKALGSRAVDGVVAGLKALPGKIRDGIVLGINKLVELRNRAFTAALTLGHDLVTGILSGLGNLASALYEKLKGAVSGALDRVKGFFGIGSPSKWTAERIGKPLADGIVAGFTEGAKQFHRMRVAAPTAFADRGGLVGAMSPGRAVPVGGGTVNIYLTNHGVLGSRREVMRWINDAGQEMRRQGWQR